MQCPLNPPLFQVQQDPENGSNAQLRRGAREPRMKKGRMWVTQPLLFLLQLQQLQVVVVMMMMMMMMMVVVLNMRHLYPWHPQLGATRQEGAKSQPVEQISATGCQSHSQVLPRAPAAQAEAMV